MAQIRKQSILSSVIVYIGFAIGFFNTYLFTREGGFSQEEYGLTGIFIAIGSLMFSLANIGITSYIYKFYPYYNDNLPKKKNDMISISLLVSLISFALMTFAGIYFKDLVIRKFGANSPLVVQYYFWIFPFGLGITLYTILEGYAWQLRESVFTNFLREVLFRLFTTLLIILTFTGFIADFDLFIKIYSYTYLAIAFVLIAYLVFKGYITLTFTISNVTKRFKKKIITLASYVYGGSIIFALATVFDSLVIAAALDKGLAKVAVYTLAQNIASLVQAPQRGVIAASIAALSKAWKDKDLGRIERIYKQSSINQLIFAIAMFSLIWLNFSDGVLTFKLQSGYIDAKWIFFYIGIMRIIDMGTGVNAQIIATSTLWRFEFFTGIILLLLTLPLNYILTKDYFAERGPAIANLFSFTIYNAIRFWFLKKKYNMQPFSAKTAYTVILGFACFFITYFLFDKYTGFIWIVLRSALFLVLYITGTIWLQLSHDIIPVWHTILKRIGIKKGE